MTMLQIVGIPCRLPGGVDVWGKDVVEAHAASERAAGLAAGPEEESIEDLIKRAWRDDLGGQAGKGAGIAGLRKADDKDDDAMAPAAAAAKISR